MLNKLVAIFLGAVLWGLGANLDVAVAFGKYGFLAFLAAAVLAAGLLIRQGFAKNQAGRNLWVTIFRGLAIEALFFPLANIIMEYTELDAFPADVTRTLLLQSGVLVLILIAVFLFIAHLLNRKVRREANSFKRRRTK